MAYNVDRLPTPDPTDAAHARRDAPADAGLLDLHHRQLLYGGGIVISIVLAIAMCALLYSMARDEIARRYTDFAVRKLLIQLEFQAREFAGQVRLHPVGDFVPQLLFARFAVHCSAPARAASGFEPPMA